MHITNWAATIDAGIFSKPELVRQAIVRVEAVARLTHDLRLKGYGVLWPAMEFGGDGKIIADAIELASGDRPEEVVMVSCSEIIQMPSWAHRGHRQILHRAALTCFFDAVSYPLDNMLTDKFGPNRITSSCNGETAAAAATILKGFARLQDYFSHFLSSSSSEACLQYLAAALNGHDRTVARLNPLMDVLAKVLVPGRRGVPPFSKNVWLVLCK